MNLTQFYTLHGPHVFIPYSQPQNSVVCSVLFVLSFRSISLYSFFVFDYCFLRLVSEFCYSFLETLLPLYSTSYQALSPFMSLIQIGQELILIEQIYKYT